MSSPRYEIYVRRLVLDPALGEERERVAAQVQQALTARLGGAAESDAAEPGVGERIADAIAERIPSTEGGS